MSLVAPLYLAALAALALPWVLHRFSETPPDLRPFPSTRFLEPSAPPVSRRRTLRHRALLALRALALLALCLLFAEPWVARPEALADARRLHVVAIDTSLSMRAGERAARARAAARERLGEVPAGDSVQLLAFDGDVTLVTAEPLTAPEAIGALGRLAAGPLASGFEAADYGRLMQRLDRLADESPLPLDATLITDVQRSALPERRNALYAPRLGSLDIVDIGAGETNVALAASAASENGAQASVAVTLLASGPAAGGAGGGAEGESAAGAAVERTVVVSHDGETLARERVRLAPGERERLMFDAVTLPAEPAPRLTIALDGEDALVDDDRVSIPVRTGGARPVALGALDARVSGDARVFVTTALEAEGAASVDDSALAAGQLPEDRRRLVVFAPLVADEPLPAALRRFVARGGSALLVDGASRDGGNGGVDASSGEIDALRGSGVGRVDEAHPLALGDIDWGDTRFFALGALVPEEGDRVLIETETRRPVLLERPSEAGLMLVLNERLDGIDSNLPFQPAFVALMRHIVDWFDAGRAVPERVTVGEAVALPVNVQVLDPAGRALVSLADTATAQTRAFDEPGLYTVVGALGEQSLQVELDPRASDLERIDDAAIAAWQTSHEAPPDASDADLAAGAAAGDDAPVAGGTASSARERAARLALWPLLLPLLAALLLAETLFANRRLDVRRDGA